MFGYVTINKPELKIKEYNKYHSYYCGLCHTLKKRHGVFGQMTLTYDMTFLVVLLTSLYESITKESKKHCIVHPVKKHELRENEITEYAADMNIALAYHNFIDDWQDEKKITSLAGAKVISGRYQHIEQQYKRQCESMKKALAQLKEYELNEENSLDLVSGCFGELMAELFVFVEDEWESELRKLGFFLGKFIYLIDAYFDLEEDIKNNSYNPLKQYKDRKDYEEFCFQLLTMMIAETAVAFERLPIIQDVEIIRNILYGGVWAKYNLKRAKDRGLIETN